MNDVLVVDKRISRTTVRRFVLRHNLLPYFCNVCGQGPYWNGKPMSLILDHINGISYDHRLENLQWVCGNCNLQLDTYGARNAKRVRTVYYCVDCRSTISREASRCKSCAAKKRHKDRSL